MFEMLISNSMEGTVEDFTYPSPSQPGNILFWAGRDGCEIWEASVEGGWTYEIEAMGLDSILDFIGDKPKAEGWYVVTRATCFYMRGDGWTTDDDVEFSHEGIRPALSHEMESAGVWFGADDI